MKAKILSGIIVGIFSFCTLLATPLQINVQAPSAILLNARTGAVLFEKNSREKRSPASITKVATAIYVVENIEQHNIDLQTVLKATADDIGSVSAQEKERKGYKLPKYWMEKNLTHMGIKNGEELSIEALLYGVLLVSAGDAANVLGHYISGTIPQFMTEMNAHLQQIGCKDTFFNNPHGAYDPEHLTTAYDMALITAKAFQHPLIREISKKPLYQRPDTNVQKGYPMVNTNLLIQKSSKFYSPYVIGAKTGYYHDHNIVAAADNGERFVAVVVMGNDKRSTCFTDVLEILKAAFSEKRVEKLVMPAGPQAFTREIEGGNAVLATYTKDPLVVQYYPSEVPKVSARVVFGDVKLPVEKDQLVGAVEITVEGRDEPIKASLYAAAPVEKSIWSSVKGWFGMY